MSLTVVAKEAVDVDFLYDFGVERTHNFVLANGLVAKNCFNKCLDATELVVVDGGVKEIQHLIPDELVLVSTSTGLVQARVKELIDSGIQEVFEVVFEDGTAVRCTSSHRFLCEDSNFYSVEEILSRGLSVKKEGLGE